MTWAGDTYHCERCGELLNPQTAVGLELNSRTGLYCLPDTVPPENSQGLFYFGKACAKAVLAAGGVVVTTGKRRAINSPKRKR